MAVYELAPGELELLRQACYTVDSLRWLTEQLADEPMTTAGSTGQPVANPLLAALSDGRRVLTTLMQNLALPMPDEAVGRVRTTGAAAAAQERWRREKESRRGQVG